MKIGTEIWPLVSADLVAFEHPQAQNAADDGMERDRVGAVEYGVHLTSQTAVDGLVEAYAEALDMCAYLRLAIFQGRLVEDSAIYRHALKMVLVLRGFIEAEKVTS